MKLNQQTIEKLAEHLENAELQAHDVVKITDDHPEMDWDDAYAIQAKSCAASWRAVIASSA
jgi:2-oxo-3-hexenedioate decarboxylase